MGVVFQVTVWCVASTERQATIPPVRIVVRTPVAPACQSTTIVPGEMPEGRESATPHPAAKRRATNRYHLMITTSCRTTPAVRLTGGAKLLLQGEAAPSWTQRARRISHGCQAWNGQRTLVLCQ